ncbi:MAG: NADH-cytochrome b5 reductase [Sarea resinae]|nr:MAG: NADH-cytochrome b5 reductase [Sarea resinae]
MFARNAFRSVQSVKTSVRHYATEPAKTSSNTALYLGLAAAAGAGGYYYLNSGKGAAAPASKDEAKSIPKQAGEKSLAFKGGDQGFIDLKLASVEEINHNTKRFKFALPNEDDISGMVVCSALLTKFQGPGMEKPVIRPYTPTSDPDTKGYLELIVKRYPNGPMSEHFHDLKPDQRLEFKGPIPKYAWTPNKHDHIALIAGGTGITPMWQLAQAIFKNPEDKTKVTLVFGNISEQDILLKKEFEALENTYPNRFKAFYVLDNPPKEWAGGKGFITKDLLKTVLPEPKSENIKLFVCGPPPLYKALSGVKKSPTDQGDFTGALKELGYNADQVYKF